MSSMVYEVGKTSGNYRITIGHLREMSVSENRRNNVGFVGRSWKNVGQLSFDYRMLLER